MLMLASSEFVALCRAQLMLLTQALGATAAIVYLTQEAGERGEAQLVPIVVYPEGGTDRERYAVVPLLPSWIVPSHCLALSTEIDGDGDGIVSSVSSAAIAATGNVQPEEKTDSAKAVPLAIPPTVEPQTGSIFSPSGSLVEQRQIVVPLMHEEMVLGVLVARRDDRSWSAWEREQVGEIARTLAIACVLDQRYQWLERQRHQERRLERQRHDMVDNLLHQFRNSLTALQTFGKLILKRLQPDENSSREVTMNLMREAERLRELAQQLEKAAKVEAFRESALDIPKISLLPIAPSVAIPESSSGPGLSSSEFSNSESSHSELSDWMLSNSEVSNSGVSSSTLPVTRCLVESVLEPLAASARAIAEEKGLTIHAHIPEDLPPIWANAQALREVLNNLIENALKYTPAGGRVLIVVKTTEDSPWLEISVSDTGPGIPPQDLPHLFERHFRGVQAQGEIPGSGLGLAIARGLVEQMHGKIQVISPASAEKQQPGFATSPDHGRGTAFLVQFPVAVDENATT
jgi:signal transduction histidine kinase